MAKIQTRKTVEQVTQCQGTDSEEIIHAMLVFQGVGLGTMPCTWKGDKQ